MSSDYLMSSGPGWLHLTAGTQTTYCESLHRDLEHNKMTSEPSVL